MQRTEKDSLGTVKVPKNAYYGAFTVRAQNNFQISNLKAPSIFRESLGMVKLAALITNTNLGLIPKKHSKAAQQACKEFIEGELNEQFTLDVFQAGAGTSYNMNSNEVIANRANEILKAPKGSYKFLHPNNHINMGQSTNDLIPTVTRLAALLSLPTLLQNCQNLEDAFRKLAKENAKVTKVGRTHLQDAVPITLGQEFEAYAEALRKSREFIEERSKDLQTLGIGGTAVGTGINAHPKYKAGIVKELSKLSGIKFKSAKNLTEIASNMNSFANLSAALRSLATNLLNICGDLKLLSMGPKAGITEISLPEVQPGSSIMPGKVNPSIPESIEMVALQVIGNDTTISTACGKSQFDLNVFCPIIMHNLIQSIEILSSGCQTLKEKCVSGIKVNHKRIQELFDNSLCTATELAPRLGYALTAEIVKSALKKGITIKAELKNRNLG